MIKMKNKAQTEAIGLAVIVILISLAIIFALAFSLREKPTITNYKRNISQSSAGIKHTKCIT